MTPEYAFPQDRLQLARAGNITGHDPFLIAFNGGNRQLRHDRENAGRDRASDAQDPREHLFIDLAFAPQRQRPLKRADQPGDILPFLVS